jgi:putative ABC transport system permease protein
LPEVKDAGAATVLPLNPFGIDFEAPWRREGEAEPQRANAAKAHFRSVTPTYFQAMGIPLLGGRAFSEFDELDAPRVVIVNRALAERAWPGENAVGKRLRLFWADWQSYEVVGVAGATKSYGLASDWRAELFVPHAQIPYTAMNVVVRTANNPAGIIPDVRRVMLGLDATQPPHSIVSMGELLADSIAKEKFALLLLEALAALALLLATMGIYSAMSYDIARRVREIGVRIALGAQSTTVLRLIVGKGLRLAMLGIAAGCLGAFGMARLMENLLFGVTPTDQSTFVLSPILLLFVALLACLAPACRATRIDPLVALKSE